MNARCNGIGTKLTAAALASLLLAACPDDADTLQCPAGTVRIVDECVSVGDAGSDPGPGTGDTAAGDPGAADVPASDAPATDAPAPDVGPDTPGALTLPFAIDDHYGPSGYFPAAEAPNIDPFGSCPQRAGDQVGLCHAFTWTPGSEGFAGVWWQHPDGNWGDLPGLAVPAGATAITFWAWGASGGESVEFLSGFASDGYEVKTEAIALTTTPTEYTLYLTDATYTTIAGGFGFVATPASGGGPVTLYIDDIEMTNAALGAGCTDPEANNYDPAAVTDDGSCTYDAVQLPFAIDDWYGPSGYFPGGEAPNLDGTGTCPQRAGDEVGLCHAFTWTPGSGAFAGVWWQYPDGNWGDGGDPGLAIAAGATAITFWAWGASGGEVVKFLSGYASDPYEADTGEITLTTTPTEYRIDLSGVTFDTLAGGFGWVAADGGLTFYVDDIEMTDAAPPAGAGCTDAAANNYDADATTDDGSCTYDVTFEVDMACSGVTLTGPVAISGPFCSWCASGYDLADADGDDVWTGTFSLPAGALEYKYMANGFDVQEDLIGDACAPVTDGSTYANREVTLSGPETLSDTWGQCTACP